MKKKILAIALAACIIVGGVVGATMSYFTDTDTKTNTFTFGKGVYIDLTETSTADPGNNILAGTAYDSNGNILGINSSYKPELFAGFKFDNVQPGLVYSKKPVVKVDADSNDCWLVATVKIPAKALLYKVYENDNTVNHGTWLSLAGSAALVKGGISDYTATGAVYNGMTGNMLNDGTNDVAFVAYSEDDTSITYTYYFIGEQAANAEYTLFDTVKIPTGLTQDMLKTANVGSFNLIVNAYAIQADGFADAYAAYKAAFGG